MKRFSILFVFLSFLVPAIAKEKPALYPTMLDEKPDIASPCVWDDGMETITVRMKDGKYTVVPVTLVNEEPLDFTKRQYGKGKQLEIDQVEFPKLKATGLHNETQLRNKLCITMIAMDNITKKGRPKQASGSGFMAIDEDIQSVLIGDNRLVKKLGLTHPECAKPLFHVWNMVLAEYRENGPPRYIWNDLDIIFYNGREIHFFGQGSRGFQESLFNDEIRGNASFDIWCDLTEHEKEFLKKHYDKLSKVEFNEMADKLTAIKTSEMEPYYIMRYGFYEGHTSYRTDPIAISFIFGLKTIEDICNAFPGNLDTVLTEHFTDETVK